jgi:UDP-glucuronate decarboxylase
VSDLVSGLVKLMNSPAEITGPVNLGNPGEFTMFELASLVLKKTMSRSDIVFLPLPPDDPKQRRPDISLARQALNWTPTIGLDEGLGHTIEYFSRGEIVQTQMLVASRRPSSLATGAMA